MSPCSSPRPWPHRRKRWPRSLSGFTPSPALPLVRARIQALNAAHGTPETIARGYHETITAAYLRLIAAALADDRAVGETSDDSHAFLARHPKLAVRERLLDYYSRERLFSPEAKRGFAQPDRQPLP